MTILIVIALLAALVGWGLQLRDRRLERLARIAACDHQWVYLSAYDQGVYWQRFCKQGCGHNESVAKKDVPEEWL